LLRPELQQQLRRHEVEVLLGLLVAVARGLEVAQEGLLGVDRFDAQRPVLLVYFFAQIGEHGVVDWNPLHHVDVSDQFQAQGAPDPEILVELCQTLRAERVSAVHQDSRHLLRQVVVLLAQHAFVQVD